MPNVSNTALAKRGITRDLVRDKSKDIGFEMDSIPNDEFIPKTFWDGSDAKTK